MKFRCDTVGANDDDLYFFRDSVIHCSACLTDKPTLSHSSHTPWGFFSVVTWRLNKLFPDAFFILKYKRSAAFDVFFILKPTHVVSFDSPQKINWKETIQSVPEANNSFY